MSVAGVARDLAARLGLPFAVPAPAVSTAAPLDGRASVEVEDPTRCGRFVAQLLTGVRIGPSPAWLAARLTLAGMRPINNVVDASNYVMLELGPAHPPLRPRPAARARPAGAPGRATGETLVTLDGVERRFVPEDLLICDADDARRRHRRDHGRRRPRRSPTPPPRCCWRRRGSTPVAVARTSKRLDLRTEASARFEKGADPDGTSTGPSPASASCSAPPAPPAEPTWSTPGELPSARRCGSASPGSTPCSAPTSTDEQVPGYLEPLGFAAEPAGDGVPRRRAVPSWRPDCTARDRRRRGGGPAPRLLGDPAHGAALAR